MSEVARRRALLDSICGLLRRPAGTPDRLAHHGRVALAPHAACFSAASAACGGSTPAKTEEPASTSAPPASPPSAQKPAGKPLGQLREEFMSKCVEGTPAPDYCQCSWDVMAKQYTLDELNSETVDQAKMRAFEDGRRSRPAPASSPRPRSRRSFRAAASAITRRSCLTATVRGPSSGSSSRSATSPTTTPRARHASSWPRRRWSRSAARGCLEDALREEFFHGCTKDEPQRRPFCDCVWKTMRAALSPAQIASASADDLEPFKPKITTACAPLVHK